MEPGGAAYNVSGALRLVGALDVAVLERCLTDVVRRHETLRTTFTDENGEATARVHAPLDVSLPVLDLSAATDIDRAARTRELLRREASRGFDLSRGDR